jgi:hypothetical protein
MSGQIDTNVNNYSRAELLAILDLDDEASDQDIINASDNYIDKFTNENKNTLALFFQKIQDSLLASNDNYIDDANASIDGPQLRDFQTDLWYGNQALPQSDANQRNKITDREQKIDVYDNDHVPMNRQQLGVANVVDPGVAQDTLNPNLKNITSRYINLDSQFRQPGTTATDYTLDLSDPLTNVLSLRLYSIQIPFTWYKIDYKYNNTCFWVHINDSINGEVDVLVSIEPGNYNPTTFQTALNTSFTNAGFTGFTVSYSSASAKLTIKLDGAIYTDPTTLIAYTISGINPTNSTFDANTDSYFIFFDSSGHFNCDNDNNYCNQSTNMTFNNTLGWIMGFRLATVPVYNGSGNTGDAVLDLTGTKYLILILDDYNQNHINNGLISITEISNKVNMPSYYNLSLPKYCPPVTTFNNEFNPDEFDATYNPTPTYLPSAPRTLKQAQLYTINEIAKNNNRNTNYRTKAPTSSDTFALVPIKYGSMNTGEMYVEFGGTMQDNKRIYFGPVNIDRMHIKLIDDKGYTLDLHGADWCITLISENLYQY